MSSNPITDSWSGTSIRSARAASSTPSAWTSDAANTAVGGYGSLSNYQSAEKHGAVPFIAFKSIHTGGRGRLVG